MSGRESANLTRGKNDRRYELKRKNSPLSRIGVDIRELLTAPKISSILREIQGGKSKAIAALRFSESDCAAKFLAKYDSISVRDRDKLPIQAVALAAKINPRELLGEIMLAMREHSVNAVKIIAVASHPDVIRKRVEFAQLPGGFRDRDALDTMLGALPSPKGPTFINKFFAGGSKEESSSPEPVEEISDDLEYMFPDASAIQERAQPMRQKLLESGK